MIGRSQLALGPFPPSLWYFDLKHSKTLPFRATAFGLAKSFDVLGLGAIAPYPSSLAISSPSTCSTSDPSPISTWARQKRSSDPNSPCQSPFPSQTPPPARMKILPWGHFFLNKPSRGFSVIVIKRKLGIPAPVYSEKFSQRI